MRGRRQEKLLPLAAGKRVAVVGPFGVATFDGMLSDYFGDEVCFTPSLVIPARVPCDFKGRISPSLVNHPRSRVGVLHALAPGMPPPQHD